MFKTLFHEFPVWSIVSDMHDTIFAFATPEGRSAIAVLRLSGSQCATILSSLAGRNLQPRRATLAKLREPDSGDILDQAIVVWSPAPGSFTGEDCLEFHLHGSLAVRKKLTEVLLKFADCRLADPGEFTRRAFLNGKADLPGVEGLADLLDAETEMQRRQALRQLDGGGGRQAERWRNSLLNVMALLEATIDFADEGDVPPSTLAAARQEMQALLATLERELAASDSAEMVRRGFRVVIAGPPNSGKSSLLNAIARRDVAIVTANPGTTRDILEIAVDLGGFLIRFADTAGLRETQDEAEKIGVRRAMSAARNADLVLWLSECGKGPAPAADQIGDLEPIIVCSKLDLLNESTLTRADGIWVSTKTGAGIDTLLSYIRGLVCGAVERSEQGVVLQIRQRFEVELATLAIRHAIGGLGTEPDEVVCEHLRAASDAIARMSGKIGVEDVLGQIFERFCIGK